MRRAVLGTILMACAIQLAYAQAADPAASFEVASVKTGGPPTPQPGPNGQGTMMRSGCWGGPGSDDPGRYTCQSATLSSIVVSAYELKRYQYAFPASMSSTYFEVAAKVPAETTKEQFRLMKQNLLAERFKLAVHFEKKEMQVYELSIGKDGPKLKESAPEPEGQPDMPRRDLNKLQRDADGIPILPRRAGTASVLMMSGGPNGALIRIQASAQTMEQIASQLSNLINKPVTDATGLTGKYEFTLTCAPPEGSGFRAVPAPPGATDGAAAPAPAAPVVDGAPTIFAALQQQLGLKLEQKKGMVDFLIVDHAEKTPAEN